MARGKRGSKSDKLPKRQKLWEKEGWLDIF